MVFLRHRSLAARAKSQAAASRGAPSAAADAWLQPLATTEVREGGESLWDAWHDESRRMDLAFAQTQPSSIAPLSSDPALMPVAEHGAGAPWVIDDVVALARRGGRVCPRPALWSALYLLLEGDRHSDLRPPPSRALFASQSNMHRRLQFREHIEWADRNGKLDLLANYISSLAEPDWVHMGED